MRTPSLCNWRCPICKYFRLFQAQIVMKLKCKVRENISSLSGERGLTPGRVLPMMAFRGGSVRKGYHFQASVIWMGWDSTSPSIYKGREICHLGLWKGPKRANRWILLLFRARKRYIFVIDSYLKDSDFQQLKGTQSSKQGMWKASYHLSTEGIWKGVTFS